MKNGWTGGQYSLFRALFGAYLFVHFVQLAPWAAELFSSEGVLPKASDSPLIHAFPNILALSDSPIFVTGLLVVAAMLSLLFAVGKHDRVAAVCLWYIWACLFGRNPLISNPGLPYVGWVLLAHSFLPPAPYGSWAARGRIDPGGGWRMPPGIFAVAWILMAVGYSYSGYTKLISPSWLDGTALARVLENPLARPTMLTEFVAGRPVSLLKVMTWGALAFELLFAPLALSRRLRPPLWLGMVSMHVGLIVLVDFADLSLGMLMLHLFTFDPAWIRPRPATETETIFYDGNCGLCHRAVRFVLAEDTAGNAFRFSPLGGETFIAEVPEDSRSQLADSVVVRTADGKLLERSVAARLIMHRLGGAWRAIAIVTGWIPRPVLDIAYDSVARVRHRLFQKPTEACPLLPAELRSRFQP